MLFRLFASPERHFTNVAPSFHILAFISSKTALRASISVSCAGHETPRPLSSSGLGILAKGVSFFFDRALRGGWAVGGGKGEWECFKGRMNVQYVCEPGWIVSNSVGSGFTWMIHVV